MNNPQLAPVRSRSTCRRLIAFSSPAIHKGVIALITTHQECLPVDLHSHSQTICKSKTKPGKTSSPDNSVGDSNTSTAYPWR